MSSPVVKVWIEEGCIVCNKCEEFAPNVFHVTEDSCVLKDGADLKANTDQIIEAAEECPVEIIKYELEDGTTN